MKYISLELSWVKTAIFFATASSNTCLVATVSWNSLQRSGSGQNSFDRFWRIRSTELAWHAFFGLSASIPLFQVTQGHLLRINHRKHGTLWETLQSQQFKHVDCIESFVIKEEFRNFILYFTSKVSMQSEGFLIKTLGTLGGFGWKELMNLAGLESLFSEEARISFLT